MSMPAPSVAARWSQRRVAELLRQPGVDGATTEGQPRLFRARLRRVALVWVCLSLPVVVLLGSLAETTTQYLVVFALVASGWYTSPALLNTWLAARRAPRPDHRCWWLWLGALVLMYSIGCGILVGAVTGHSTPIVVNVTAVAVTSLLLMTAVVLMVRTRSGRRALSVDLLDSAMSVIVVVAPAALVWGEDIVHADDAWYAVPAAVAAVAVLFGLYWAVLLYVRLRADGRASRVISRIGVALAVVGLANAVGQTVQGVTGFALPSGPLLGLHALCMSILLFIPLYVPDRISPGLARLPPQDQVRGAWLPATLMLVGLPVLVATTLALRERYAWATLFALGVTGVLLVLAVLRQLAAVHETRRLYREVAHAAATRRDLLAQVMQRSDDDRHRVAAQLHEQAVSAYASFVSLVQAGALSPDRSDDGVTGASALVRDELRSQAESLRELMLAVQPLGTDRARALNLDAPIHAYVDGIYGDRPAPAQSVTVADDVVLDWSTETVVLRIVQEAVRNVWRHSGASHLDIDVRVAEGGVIEVEVADDGVGFDPDTVLFESGIAAMRGFAALGQGSLTVHSAPGRGTRVVARLGGLDATAEDRAAVVDVSGVPADAAGGARPHLRLLRPEPVVAG